jgi:hypothetical protein
MYRYALVVAHGSAHALVSNVCRRLEEVHHMLRLRMTLPLTSADCTGTAASCVSGMDPW